MARWAGAADLAGYLLTGRLVTDHTLAGRTMAYRLAGAFDPELLAEAGLRVDQLPEVTNDPVGARAGVRAGTPVLVAGHDHAVGAYACGVREPGDVADSLGTAEAVMTVTAGHPDPVGAARQGMSTVVTVGGRHRALIAGSPSCGAAIDWWLTHEHLDPTIFDRLGDDPTGILVLPYLAGRQAPDPDPAAHLRVIGRHPGHTRAELAQALLEGLCLHTRWMLEEQSRLAGAPPAVVRLFGGPVAANPAWVRIRAAVLPAPLRVVAEPEPVAIGAAMLACGATMTVPAPLFEPGGPDYDSMFAAFRSAVRKDPG
jgi:sugar (pentulose or hexulose) kinase